MTIFAKVRFYYPNDHFINAIVDSYADDKETNS